MILLTIKTKAMSVHLKLSIITSDLVKILKNHEKCVNENDKVTPNGGNILIELLPSQICLMTEKSGVFIRSRIETPNANEVRILVPFKKLVDLLKLLSEQYLKIKIDADVYHLQIVANEGTYEIAGENPDTFPEFPQDESTEWFKASGTAFRSAVENVLYAVSTDDLRPIQRGVFFEVSQESISLIATNGTQLSKSDMIKEFKVFSPTNEVIRGSFLGIIQTITPATHDVKMWTNGKLQWVQIGDIELCSPGIEGNYPNWRSAVPTAENKVKIERNAWITSLGRMLLFVNERCPVVKTEIKSKAMSIHAEDIDFEIQGQEFIKIETQVGQDSGEIFLDAKAVKEMLTHISQEQVWYEYSAPNRAVSIVHEEGFAMIVPQMSNTY